MASPLSPIPSSVLNSSTPYSSSTTAARKTTTTTTTTTNITTTAHNSTSATSWQQEKLESLRTYGPIATNMRTSPNGAITEDDARSSSTTTSSPFLSHIRDDTSSGDGTQQMQMQQQQENLIPPRGRPASRIISGAELSPLKILQEQHKHTPSIEEEEKPASASTSTSTSASGSISGSTATSMSAATSNTASSSSAPNSATPHSPRKMLSPVRRFPIKINPSLPGTPRTSSSPPSSATGGRVRERQMSLAEAMHDNEGLKHAIEIFEDEASVMSNDDGTSSRADTDTTLATVEEGEAYNGPSADEQQYQRQQQLQQGYQQQQQQHQEYYDEGPLGTAEYEENVGPDDTMVSTLSTFSAVPNLTMLAHMRSNNNTPVKMSGMMAGGGGNGSMATPRAATKTSRSSLRESIGSNSTNLMEFTEQLRFGSYHTPQQQQQMQQLQQMQQMQQQMQMHQQMQQMQTPQRRDRLSVSPSSSMMMGQNFGGEGNNNYNNNNNGGNNNGLVSLLDFDIPPMPTPRSIPTITPRELESLKSGFLSEISSLKASLSGKAAEVLSLKAAVGDAETRVGECLEQLYETRGQHDALVAERDVWEKRGREMEAVLRKVKEEIVMSRHEREDLEMKLDESEKRREAAEMMAQEAESKMAGMRAGRAGVAAGGNKSPTPSHSASSSVTGAGTAASNKEVETAVERVARELHALYKSKHETKVAALKKSYETRWEKKVHELEAQVEDLARENEELRIGRDATLTHVDPAKLAEREAALQAERARDAAQLRELVAEVERLEAVLKTVQADNADLRALLERERVEKGELVILAEEMMSMQQQQQSFIASQPNESSNSSGNNNNNNNNNGGRSSSNNNYHEEDDVTVPIRPAVRSGSSSTPSSSIKHATTTPRRTQSQNQHHNHYQAADHHGSSTNHAASSSHGGNSHLMKSANRTSGLRAPGGLKSAAAASESRIGRMAHERTRSTASSASASSAAAGGVGGGDARPGSGLRMRSGIMSSIEKMGSYRRE